MTVSQFGLLALVFAFAVPVSADTQSAKVASDSAPRAQVARVERHGASPRRFPLVEFSGGYSYANLGLGSQSSVFMPSGKNFNGGQFDAKFNLRNYAAFLFDVAGESAASQLADPLGYETHLQLGATQLLVGPEFTARGGKFNCAGSAGNGERALSVSE